MFVRLKSIIILKWITKLMKAKVYQKVMFTLITVRFYIA